ncbi:NUDIX hydrolase [Staphylospora marina]|uniref:NUDIX hydrolase n=1 Tax=Staphylospora marina TaxID=2490858 RepID=UPI000F5BAA89|nr:NUDIX hydrolase [Staphylospora marina]
MAKEAFLRPAMPDVLKQWHIRLERLQPEPDNLVLDAGCNLGDLIDTMFREKGAIPLNNDLAFRYEWKYKKEDLKYCPRCGHRFSLEDLHIPDQPQLVCHRCRFVFYLDPKLAVVAVVLNRERTKVLLLQRNEAPGKGLWAFPGGYVERGQDLFETIQNEVKEETGLTVKVGKIIDTLSLPEDGLVQLTY